MAIITKIFIERALAIHSNKFTYESSIYVNAKTKISITCPLHGLFLQTPSNHLHKKFPQGCPKCCKTQKSSTEDFITKANLIHKERYNYELTHYHKVDLPVIITCKVHGNFQQLPKHHLSGHGCTKCNIVGGIGFTKEAFINKFKNKQCLCYIIHCFDKNESFIKIGITGKSITKRFPDKSSLPYNYKCLHSFIGNPDYIFDLEKQLQEKFAHISYKPLKIFCGNTECYQYHSDILLLNN
jgi:hypothetical protein